MRPLPLQFSTHSLSGGHITQRIAHFFSAYLTCILLHLLGLDHVEYESYALTHLLADPDPNYRHTFKRRWHYGSSPFSRSRSFLLCQRHGCPG
ncbi:hypothetical protein RSAG8_06145, partial [Rhizoctonia solani AG-8 WAC10335]